MHETLSILNADEVRNPTGSPRYLPFRVGVLEKFQKGWDLAALFTFSPLHLCGDQLVDLFCAVEDVDARRIVVKKSGYLLHLADPSISLGQHVGNSSREQFQDLGLALEQF